jgi:hypothetical protein
MNLIFLDVDDVLNVWGYVEKQCLKHPLGSDYSYDAQFNFSPEIMQNLQSLVFEFDAYLVICSCWRLIQKEFDVWKTHPQLIYMKDRHWKELMRNLNEYFIGDRVIGVTPSIWYSQEQEEHTGRSYAERGEEIKLWLKTNLGLGVRSFVIIDDSTDMLDLRDTHLAHCTIEGGFDSVVLEDARRILSTPNMISFE